MIVLIKYVGTFQCSIPMHIHLRMTAPVCILQGDGKVKQYETVTGDNFILPFVSQWVSYEELRFMHNVAPSHFVLPVRAWRGRHFLFSGLGVEDQEIGLKSAVTENTWLSWSNKYEMRVPPFLMNF